MHVEASNCEGSVEAEQEAIERTGGAKWHNKARMNRKAVLDGLSFS